jgi:hypothetical protein
MNRGTQLARRVFHPDWLPLSFVLGFSVTTVLWLLLAVLQRNLFAIIVHGACLLYAVAFLWFEINDKDQGASK